MALIGRQVLCLVIASLALAGIVLSSTQQPANLPNGNLAGRNARSSQDIHGHITSKSDIFLSPLFKSSVHQQISDSSQIRNRYPPDPNLPDDFVDLIPAPTSDIYFNIQPDSRLHDFKEFVDDPKAVEKEDVWLVMYVPCALALPRAADVRHANPLLSEGIRRAGNDLRHRRDAVRKYFHRSLLWKRNHSKLFFVVSWNNSYITPDIRARVEEESAIFGDLLFVGGEDLDGGFSPPSAMTTKVGYALLHAATFFRFAWFVRGSDDAYFNADQFYRVVRKQIIPRSRVAVGTLLFDVSTSKGRDFHVHKFGRMFPPFFSGMGYIFSADVVQSVVTTMRAGVPLHVGWPEDAIVSSWVQPLALHVIDSARWFHNDVKPGVRVNSAYPGCVEDAILVHLLNPSDFNSIDKRGVYKGCARTSKRNHAEVLKKSTASHRE